MCGIVGWVDWKRDLSREANTVFDMTRTLTRRGPDDEGIWTAEQVAFGHRRLSIIDLRGGAQPMVVGDSEEPLAVITYGGEIYNFRELRAELTLHGHLFRTRSDTEVILRAFLHWGTAAFAKLNGMFAFAIWDIRRRELWLVRDHFGIKPLYYYPTQNGLIFASEPKAILAHPHAVAEVDTSGIAEIFVVASAPTPGHGVYRGLQQVKPGHALKVSESGFRDNLYWSLPTGQVNDGPERATAHVRELLEDIVEHQMMSDVALGGLLSGGLDSSAISALAARKLGTGHRLSTFSVDFPDSAGLSQRNAWHDSHDEPYAREVSSHIGSHHTTVLVKPEDAQKHEEVVLRARDLPGWGEMDISLYLLMEQIRPHATVVLSGEAADEVFGGYPYFHDEHALEFEGFPWMQGRSTPSILLRDDIERTVQPATYMKERYHEALAEAASFTGESPHDVRLRKIGYLALTRWLPALLDRNDRMSMAAGVEARVPYCDHRLVEYVWMLPWNAKNSDGIEKTLLRRAVADLLPRSVFTRRKSAFPANPDVRYQQSLRERVDDLLATPSAPVFELVEPFKVRAFLNDGVPLPSPRSAASQTAGLSFLLNVNQWLQTYRVSIR
ncbi:asparagine synthase (glutamine-hydrolyzing) [Rhodomicrobium sp.]|uniref:asparagine synthase (glutamine-hydrolyzing) n=1 Tax=Rhodomicrobium sp. TaxID=2720632 RepID=UPI0039E5EF18